MLIKFGTYTRYFSRCPVRKLCLAITTITARMAKQTEKITEDLGIGGVGFVAATATARQAAADGAEKAHFSASRLRTQG